MRVSIHQPAYLPWLGYFDKIFSSDVFVFLDTVSYSKNSFDNRNRIVLNQNDKWLTIPIATKGKFGQNYLEAKAINNGWKKSHLDAISMAYKDSKYFNEVFPRLEEIYSRIEENDSLADICWKMLTDILYVFFQDTGRCKYLVRASKLPFSVPSSKTDLLIDICKHIKDTDEYYSGIMGKEYLDEKMFVDSGINLVYQDYKPLHNLSIVHHLMNFGAYL